MIISPSAVSFQTFYLHTSEVNHPIFPKQNMKAINIYSSSIDSTRYLNSNTAILPIQLLSSLQCLGSIISMRARKLSMLPFWQKVGIHHANIITNDINVKAVLCILYLLNSSSLILGLDIWQFIWCYSLQKFKCFCHLLFFSQL